MPKITELPKKDFTPLGYNPQGEEKKVKELLTDRVFKLKELRKEKLPNNTRSIEEIWKEADQEYQPHELEVAERTRFESNDELGLRSRLVKVGNTDDWQSNAASTDFYVKLNTALSILIDQNPEAWFIASSKKYEKTTAIAYANWKQSWEVSGAKQQIKNYVFNMGKYGTAYMRTYPRIIQQEKQILKEYYPDQPDKNKFETKTITKYNDLARESLNPWSIWLGKSTRVGDYFTLEESYFEKTYTWDSFRKEFKTYNNTRFVGKGAHVNNDNIEDNDYFASGDAVTVGFYENSVLDLYSLFVPSTNIVLYYSPMPNDDGMMQITFSPWSLRDDRIPYGIGLFEIIRNDVILFDRLKNMTVDQIALTIYKMFFYKGTDILGNNEQIVITPGVGKQVSDPKAMTFLEVPGPGKDAWNGLQFLKDQIDTSSGVTPQLSAQFTSKTLGQDVQAKEAALERMKTPLDYLLDALQQEAFLTLSWQKQTLSTPEVLQYQDIENLKQALEEMGVAPQDIESYLQEEQKFQEGGQSDLFFASEADEEGQQKTYANVYPERSLNLSKDQNGELIESDEKRFFRIGLDLPTSMLEWRGMVRIKPQSILAPSKELMKRMKLDLFNLIFPSTQTMLANPATIPLLFPQVEQIIKIYDENPKDWGLDKATLDGIVQMLTAPKENPEDKPKISISMKFETLVPEVQAQILEKYVDVKPEGTVPEEEPLFVDANTGMQEEPETPPQTMEPIVPRNQLGSKASDTGMISKGMNAE